MFRIANDTVSTRPATACTSTPARPWSSEQTPTPYSPGSRPLIHARPVVSVWEERRMSVVSGLPCPIHHTSTCAPIGKRVALSISATRNVPRAPCFRSLGSALDVVRSRRAKTDAKTLVHATLRLAAMAESRRFPHHRVGSESFNAAARWHRQAHVLGIQTPHGRWRIRAATDEVGPGVRVHRFAAAPLSLPSRIRSSWMRWRMGWTTACSSRLSTLMSSPQRVRWTCGSSSSLEISARCRR